MGVKEFLSNALHKDGRFKELEKEMKMRKLLEERQKNANERELERFMEEERQKRIKENLDRFRKKQNNELWKGNLLKQRNIFKGHKSILDQDKNILENNDKLTDFKSNQFKGGMFFKR
jgi:hypothetical protein